MTLILCCPVTLHCGNHWPVQVASASCRSDCYGCHRFNAFRTLIAAPFFGFRPTAASTFPRLRRPDPPFKSSLRVTCRRLLDLALRLIDLPLRSVCSPCESSTHRLLAFDSTRYASERRPLSSPTTNNPRRRPEKWTNAPIVYVPPFPAPAIIYNDGDVYSMVISPFRCSSSPPTHGRGDPRPDYPSMRQSLTRVVRLSTVPWWGRCARLPYWTARCGAVN